MQPRSFINWNWAIVKTIMITTKPKNDEAGKEYDNFIGI